MAASAITERAAPRWVSCRSILSAMVRSCSITTTWPGRSGTGATLRSTRRSPRIARRRDRRDIRSPPRRGCAPARSARAAGLPNGTRSRSALPPQQQHRDLEEGFGRDVGLGDLAVRRDHQDRMRQRVEHGVGGAGTAGSACGSKRFMRRPFQAKASKASARCATARRAGSFGGQHARAARLEALGGAPRGLGGGVERPAEMLARMAHADACAVVRQHLVVERVRRARAAPRAAARLRGGRSRDSARSVPGTTAGPARRGRPSRRRRRKRRARRARRSNVTIRH